MERLSRLYMLGFFLISFICATFSDNSKSSSVLHHESFNLKTLLSNSYELKNSSENVTKEPLKIEKLSELITESQKLSSTSAEVSSTSSSAEADLLLKFESSLRLLTERIRKLEAASEMYNKESSTEKEISNQMGVAILSSSLITKETCNNVRQHLIGGSCYSVPLVSTNQEEFLSWWDSRFLCKKVLGSKADLISLQNLQEFSSIKRLLTTHFGGLEEFWLGASNLSGVWIWSSNNQPIAARSSSQTNDFLGTRWNFKNTERFDQPKENSPSLSTTEEPRCLSLLQDFTLTPEPCYYKRLPLCELDLSK